MGWRQVGVGGNKSIGVEIERMESMGEAGRFFLLNSSTWENQNQMFSLLPASLDSIK